MNSQNAKLFSTSQSSLTAWVKKPTLALQTQLEQNVLKWLVAEILLFTTIKQDSFQQIFSDISGINPPFGSAHTLKQKIEDEFNIYCSQLKECLDTICTTIALSLDAWSSQNHVSILAIVGHWLTPDFKYQE